MLGIWLAAHVWVSMCGRCRDCRVIPIGRRVNLPPVLPPVVTLCFTLQDRPPPTLLPPPASTPGRWRGIIVLCACAGVSAFTLPPPFSPIQLPPFPLWNLRSAKTRTFSRLITSPPCHRRIPFDKWVCHNYPPLCLIRDSRFCSFLFGISTPLTHSPPTRQLHAYTPAHITRHSLH